jgi:chloramphenicol-sensitive protein RarD
VTLSPNEGGGATRAGLLFGVGAYVFWGLMPLYFERVMDVPPLELLAQRIVWSFLLLAVLITLMRRWREVRRCLSDPRVRRLLLATTVLIALNWLAYITAVAEGRVIEASLGYYILPLVSVILGTVFLGEKLRPLQWAAVALAAGGMVQLVAIEKGIPWIAFTLAVSFSLYGLFRKQAGVDGLIGLTVETLLLGPIALGYLVWLAVSGKASMGRGDLSLDLLLLLSGVVTTIPLFCFAEAARRLPLTTLGFLQYLSPTLQLILAVTRLGESFGPAKQVGFGLIWAALVVFTVASLRGGPPPAEPEF